LSDAIFNDVTRPVDRLVTVMARLRDPKTGCPWDVEQNFETIAPYTIEEAYEVADAIHRGSPEDLREELGDLLLQVAFHSRMAEEKGWFDMNGVADAIVDKLIRRHPHVFGDDASRTTAQQLDAWEAEKAKERGEKASEDKSVLANVPVALPSLTRALKLQKRMSRVGFEWRQIEGIDEKIEEELGELAEARARNDHDAIEDELGDVLFCVVNLARRLDIDPEVALARTNRKFEDRVRKMETQGPLDGLDIDQLEERWQVAKASE
jgi:ATP diphosphatase